MSHRNGYADYETPEGRFRLGTIIRVEGHPRKADNGTFEITSIFPVQPNGRAHFQWRRLRQDGELAARSTKNHRGGWSHEMEALIDEGIITVVSEPDPETAKAAG